MLFGFDGNKIAIDSIFSFKTDTATKVFNLEVAGNNDYFVSASGVLVHNCNSYIDITSKGSRYLNKLIDITPKEFVKNLGVKFNLTKDGKAWMGINNGTKYFIRNINSSGFKGATVDVYPKTGKMMKYRLDGFYKP